MLNEQPLPYIPSGTSRRQTITDPQLSNSSYVLLGSVWMVAAVQLKPDPDEIICNMMSCGVSPFQQEKKKHLGETSPGERSSPTNLCPLSQPLSSAL